MIYDNKYFESIYIGLLFEGYSKNDAYNITIDYINSCINIRFLLLSKMIKQ